MDELTIKELALICAREIAIGNGNKKILLSNDDEGNGYHGLFYHFAPLDSYDIDIVDSCLGINESNVNEYVVLG